VLGLLGSIFSGLQQPLFSIAQVYGTPYVPDTISIPPLDRERKWFFRPSKRYKV